MKRLTLSLILVCSTMLMFAQDGELKNSDNDLKTLFGNGTKTTIGWFVGPAGGYTKFCSSDVALAGIQAGMVINHNFTIGLTGFGVANSKYLTYNNFIDTTDVRLEGGWGGLLLEYTLFPKSVVHVTFPVMIGGGQMTYFTTNDYQNMEDDEWDCDHQKIDEDAFFVVEPGVRAEINILKFMRFGAGVSYRYTPDLNMVNTSKSFINNFTASASLKFGKF